MVLFVPCMQKTLMSQKWWVQTIIKVVPVLELLFNADYMQAQK